MSTPIGEFDYFLPQNQIAQRSVEPRDASKLLVLDKKTGDLKHKIFSDIVSELRSGDLLVFNDSKVFKARLEARSEKRSHEIFLLRCVESSDSDSLWEVLVERLRRIKLGQELQLGHLRAKLESLPDDETGRVIVRIDASLADVLAYCDEHGHIPVPPYVEREPEKLSEYQNVYARETGSVAAPTAGFHFTERLLQELEERGIETAFVTLHVGLGTFQPVKTDTIEEHPMHEEYVTLSEQTAEAIARARTEGRRVIAVGTTVVRTLEGVAAVRGELRPYSGPVNLFILPGFEFKIIDALTTNFHLPKSTLLALVSAFAGRENILNAYKTAVKENYRFFSFGDAMFIS